MKFLRFFLWLLLLAVAVFFATGLLFKETKYTVKAATTQPLEEVFETFNNLDSLTNWAPDIISVQPITVKDEFVGSTYEIELKKNQDTLKMNQQIMAFVSNRKVTLHVDSEDFTKTFDYDFKKVGDSTIITKNVVYKSNSFFLQCLFPYLKTNFIEADQKYLDNFKDYINNNK